MVELRGRYSSPAIAFLGYVKPEEFFARIDVLVVPSLWEEPLGRVIYEAYARGVAVIANRLGGMPEIIEEGRTGYVVTPGDVKELAAVIEQMLTTQRRSDFRSACLAKAKEFSAERRYPEYHSVWQRALSET